MFALTVFLLRLYLIRRRLLPPLSRSPSLPEGGKCGKHQSLRREYSERVSEKEVYGFVEKTRRGARNQRENVAEKGNDGFMRSARRAVKK